MTTLEQKEKIDTYWLDLDFFFHEDTNEVIIYKYKRNDIDDVYFYDPLFDDWKETKQFWARDPLFGPFKTEEDCLGYAKKEVERQKSLVMKTIDESMLLLSKMNDVKFKVEE